MGVAIAAGSVMFITFPAQIFNLTLQENYPIIGAWMGEEAGTLARPAEQVRDPHRHQATRFIRPRHDSRGRNANAGARSCHHSQP